MTTSTQTRGHCQMCGRQQAVRGGMSAHGYTVENGWFQGVCQGHHYAPMETDRKITDQLVIDVRAQAVALRTKAEETLLGLHDPVEYKTGRYQRLNGKATPIMAPFADASDYTKNEVRKQLSWSLTSRAKAGDDFANMMAKLVDQIHGQPLLVVAKPVPAERIPAGEQRTDAKGRVLTAKYQDGQRLHYTITREDGKVLTTWMSPRSWRALSRTV